MKAFAAILLFALIIGITVSVQAQTGTGAVVGPTYYAAAYGVIADGVHDQCVGTNLSSLVATVNVTGGSIVFDAGITVLSTCNFSAASGLALGPNVFLVGRGAANDNHDTDPPSPPAILMMTCATGPCAGDVAHIECLTYGGECGAVNLTEKDIRLRYPIIAKRRQLWATPPDTILTLSLAGFVEQLFSLPHRRGLWSGDASRAYELRYPIRIAKQKAGLSATPRAQFWLSSERRCCSGCLRLCRTDTGEARSQHRSGIGTAVESRGT